MMELRIQYRGSNGPRITIDCVVGIDRDDEYLVITRGNGETQRYFDARILEGQEKQEIKLDSEAIADA